jgi:hypothetical protein
VKRTILFVAVGVFMLWAQAGSAQAPTTTTLSFYEPAEGGNFKIIDTAPKSPTKNPGSSRYRFSVGDELIFSQPLLTGPGGQRVGTLYADVKVVKGKKFSSITVMGTGTFVLNNGDQIVAHALIPLSGTDGRLAIIGGTGAYAGARGSDVTHNNADDSSTDTITLLP